MTGTELADKIKLDFRHIPVVLANGYAELSAGREPGILRLPKPFTQSQSMGALRQAVGCHFLWANSRSAFSSR
ncbi:hypothetical protein RLV_0309 (plasmid) [Rhizobium leguminosarum bv. viciae]|nr:hypothetical protein RLV_0309 [Rhizobium leguminosarum bv. viciae]